MACLLTCQSPGILKMDVDVVDIAVAGTACCFVAIAGAVEAHRRRRRRRSVWVKSWIMERLVCGAYNKLFNDLLNTDETFRNFVLMDLPAFEELLSPVEFALSKNRTRLRQPIAARERLCVVMRYLATGRLKRNNEHWFITFVADGADPILPAMYSTPYPDWRCFAFQQSNLGLSMCTANL